MFEQAAQQVPVLRVGRVPPKPPPVVLCGFVFPTQHHQAVLVFTVVIGLPREGADEPVHTALIALRAPQPHEAVCQHPALQIGAQIAFNVGRQTMGLGAALAPAGDP